MAGSPLFPPHWSLGRIWNRNINPVDVPHYGTGAYCEACRITLSPSDRDPCQDPQNSAKSSSDSSEDLQYKQEGPIEQVVPPAPKGTKGCQRFAGILGHLHRMRIRIAKARSRGIEAVTRRRHSKRRRESRKGSLPPHIPIARNSIRPASKSPRKVHFNPTLTVIRLPDVEDEEPQEDKKPRDAANKYPKNAARRHSWPSDLSYRETKQGARCQHSSQPRCSSHIEDDHESSAPKECEENHLFATGALRKRLPLDQARRRCQEIYVSFRAFSNVAQDLLRQKRCSGCAMDTTDRWSLKQVDMSEADVLEGLITNASRSEPGVEKTIQALHQMVRKCQWWREEIRDDILALCSQWTRSEPQFQTKWAPDRGRDLILEETTFNLPRLPWIHESNVDKCLAGSITSHTTSISFQYYMTFARNRKYQPTEYLTYYARYADVDNTIEQLRRYSEQQKCRLRSRCLQNVEAVKALLLSTVQEIRIEQYRLSACPVPEECQHHKAIHADLNVAAAGLSTYLNTAMVTFTDQAKALFAKDVGHSAATVVSDWASLETNRFKELTDMKTEELVMEFAKMEKRGSAMPRSIQRMRVVDGYCGRMTGMFLFGTLEWKGSVDAPLDGRDARRQTSLRILCSGKLAAVRVPLLAQLIQQ